MTEVDITLPEVFDGLFATTSSKTCKEDWDRYQESRLTEMVEVYEAASPDTKLLVDMQFNAVSAYGMRGRAKATLKQIQSEVERRRALAEAVKRVELEKKLRVHTSVWDALSSAHPPDKYATRSQLQALSVPYPYKVTEAGVYKGTLPENSLEVEWNQIMPAPMFPVSRTTDSITGEVERMILWRTASGWRRTAVEREVMLDTSKIITLASLDAPVSSPRARDVVEFLDAFEAENSRNLEEVQVSHNCGWTPDGDFVMPNAYWVRPNKEDPKDLTFVPADGMENIAAGWKTEGTWEGWLRAADLVRDKPIMWTGLYAALSAPLLKHISSSGWITDVSGETSHGKTTWLRFAASAGGRPAMDSPSVIGSWDQTPVFIEHVCAFHNNLPVFLDETKRAKYRKVVSDVAYQFWQGQGRGRGNKVGVRKTLTWKTTMLTTGEEAATNFSNDAGTRARVLCIRGKPMGKSTQENGQKAEELTYLVQENYGHVFPRFMDQLVPIVSDPEQKEALHAEWRKRRDNYATLADTGVGRRLAGYVACMSIVADMVHGRGGFEGIGVPAPTGSVSPFDVLVEAIKAAGKEADIPAEAMREVLSWAQANEMSFWRGRSNTAQDAPAGGWYGTWEENPVGGSGNFPVIGIQTSVVRRVLGQMGYTASDVTDRWAARGYIDIGSGRGKGVTTSVAGRSLYVYLFTEKAWHVMEADK